MRRLLPLTVSVADVVEKQTAENSTDEATDHIHAKLNEDIKHTITSLLKRRRYRLKRNGIGEIISEKIQPFNTTNKKATHSSERVADFFIT